MERDPLTWALVPWRLVVAVTALFLVVAGAHQHRLSTVLGATAWTGTDLPALLRLAGVGALGSNLVDNLPAYLVLEPSAAGSVERLLALVIGVNSGRLVTIWGSLATLVWVERCRSRGVTLSPGSFTAAGLVLAPGVVVLAVGALVV